MVGFPVGIWPNKAGRVCNHQGKCNHRVRNFDKMHCSFTGYFKRAFVQQIRTEIDFGLQGSGHFGPNTERCCNGWVHQSREPAQSEEKWSVGSVWENFQGDDGDYGDCVQENVPNSRSWLDVLSCFPGYGVMKCSTEARLT